MAQYARYCDPFAFLTLGKLERTPATTLTVGKVVAFDGYDAVELTVRFPRRTDVLLISTAAPHRILQASTGSESIVHFLDLDQPQKIDEPLPGTYVEETPSVRM